MKIFIGADHRGYKLKNKAAAFLRKEKYDVVDLGACTEETPCDYPELSYKVGTAVAKHKDSRGILICMTGIGHSIAANKIKGVYAALCYNEPAAEFSRRHNNANVLVLGAKFVPAKNFSRIIHKWLMTPFEGGRHLRRVKQIKAIEGKFGRTQK